MLRVATKHLLWLTAVGAVLTHATEVPVPSTYQASQQQVHVKLQSVFEQATNIKEKYQLEKARAWLSYADHAYSEKAKRQNIELIYQQVSTLN